MNVPADMKHCGGCGCIKPRSAFYRNRARKDGLQTQCKTCMDVRNTRYAEAHPGRIKAAAAKHYQANKEEVCAKAVEWRAQNLEKAKEVQRKSAARIREQRPEHVRKLNRESWQRHIEKRRAYDRARNGSEARKASAKKCRENNPGLVIARAIERKKRVRRAFPAWANKEAVRQFYEIARKLTNGTGESWHVDHIVPLKNDLVCGLHVHNNLRVIRATDNLRKNNRFDPDIPD